jgi:hypothetical protein
VSFKQKRRSIHHRRCHLADISRILISPGHHSGISIFSIQDECKKQTGVNVWELPVLNPPEMDVIENHFAILQSASSLAILPKMIKIFKAVCRILNISSSDNKAPVSQKNKNSL